MGAPRGFEPPPYPYDRLDVLHKEAEKVPGGVVDLSIGTPCDPPPAVVVEALGSSGAERGYPPSVGTAAFREAAAGWLDRRFGVAVDPQHLAACMGTKEFVAGVPHWLRLRSPDRDTVLYPRSATRPTPWGRPSPGAGRCPTPTLADVDPADAARALCLWVNSPANPTGELDDLGAAAAWGRAHDVPVLSDECYIEFTWDGPGAHDPRHEGLDGVLAVHSLSKRSNLAGARAGFYAGDPDLVHYLSEVRKHAGFMVPGPVQAAAVAAFGDDAHVDEQRARYQGRLDADGRRASRPPGSTARRPTGRSTCGRRHRTATPGRWPTGSPPRAGPSWRPGELLRRGGRRSRAHRRGAARREDRPRRAATRRGAVTS